MNETNETTAIAKISSEVDSAQFQIFLSNYCLKAQKLLLGKLSNETMRKKEMVKERRRYNELLENEIKHKESVIKSMLADQAIIRSANVELRKQCLAAKERTLNTIERVQAGEKRYEDLWEQCKNRFESIIIVQKYLKAGSDNENMRHEISKLNTQIETVKTEIKIRRNHFANQDQILIIELAQFLTRERPKLILEITQKSALVNELKNKRQQNIFSNMKQQPVILKQKEEIVTRFNNTREVYIGGIEMPKLQLMNDDFDFLNWKLSKIKEVNKENLKTNKISKLENVSDKHSDIQTNQERKSSYFNTNSVPLGETSDAKKDTTLCDYSKRKLINILEDVKIDTATASNLLSMASKARKVEFIGTNDLTENNKVEKSVDDDETIEEVDITNSNKEYVIVPPTQFRDLSQGIFKCSQQKVEDTVQVSAGCSPKQKIISSQETKKKVTFDIPSTSKGIPLYTLNEIDQEILEENKKENADCSINSQADTSVLSDAEPNYAKMKDMMLKKHNLYLSPEFVYSKNNITPAKSSKDEAVTSKFFKEEKVIHSVNSPDKNVTGKSIDDNHLITKHQTGENELSSKEKAEVVEKNDVLKDKEGKSNNICGLLFNHGAKDSIIESLDISINTTGFEDGDNDYPQCIDSSLLLSPKPDIPISADTETAKGLSPEVPNFLTGLRKAGMSFFGTKSNLNESTQGNNFNFNFGGEEKNNRSGLFSMFR